MKKSDILNEGIFQDLASTNFSSGRGNSDKDREKFQAQVLANTKKPYINDFKEDFLADFKAGIDKTFDPNIETQPEAPRESPKSDHNPFKHVSESIDYVILDSLVESIINEETKLLGIQAWILKWFTAYMDGTDWQSRKNDVLKIAKSIEQKKGTNFIPELNLLAEISWDVVSKIDNKSIPYGAKDVFGNRTGNKMKLTPDQVLQAQSYWTDQEKQDYERKRKL